MAVKRQESQSDQQPQSESKDASQASNVSQDSASIESFSPKEQKNEGFDFLGALQNVGNMFGTAMDALDTPNKWIGDGLDWLYDNTIGELTGTRNLFTGEEAAWLPRIASMLVPGIGGVKAAGAINNLRNVNRFEKALENIKNTNSVNTYKNSIAGHVGKYGEDLGAKRAAAQFGQYTKADKELGKAVPTEIILDNLNIPINKNGLSRHLERNAIESPSTLYRGGDTSGWFFTPDKRIAKDYVKKYGGNIQKVPKGSKVAPGKWYEPLSPTRDINGREVIIKPEWING